MFICWWKGELIVKMFTSTVTFSISFYNWKFHLCRSKFRVIFLQFHSFSTWGSSHLHVNANHIWMCVILMRKCTFHISKTTNHMTIFNSCLKVRSWRIETDEIRSNWVKTKTLSWKLPGLVGLQGCRERMISNLTTTEPRYMTVIISSTVNTTLSTAALTTLTHTYL